jgi:hypothetical protein
MFHHDAQKDILHPKPTKPIMCPRPNPKGEPVEWGRCRK